MQMKRKRVEVRRGGGTRRENCNTTISTDCQGTSIFFFSRLSLYLLLLSLLLSAALFSLFTLLIDDTPRRTTEGGGQPFGGVEDLPER